MDCYIYYKTAAEHERQVIIAVTQLQKTLLETLGLEMRLQRRPELSAGFLTWMEIYRDIPDDFQRQLTSLLKTIELHPLLNGERHAEYFEDAFVCA